ncbi:PH domain-containing protein [Vibrio alginolyticus]|uniref:PH domain-containing protein n=1 Tax=Vibrio alginolyticus TaxID=663 RepID=UPI0006D07520|nr:PH domain-containing protein [Vibrio alginolyticus]ELB2281351.1 PH domain-containing protein [Vibrio alginolyticus]MCR9998934.1 PH domain-containing protein [Vibrio alginolyticus]
MIDFDNSSVFKLKPIDVSNAREDFLKFLIDGETIFAAFKTVRDQVVFTNKRVIAANVQGITGSKVDYISLPYSKINAFSIETSGTFDLDCEIEFFMSEVGRVRFEIKGSFDLISFNRMVSEYVLG